MGYKTIISPNSPDRGRDIVASPDGSGLEEPRIIVEVKHRTGSMGANSIRSFTGGLRNKDRGLYVSTGGFSKEAKYEAERPNIPVTLIDAEELARLLELIRMFPTWSENILMGKCSRRMSVIL